MSKLLVVTPEPNFNLMAKDILDNLRIEYVIIESALDEATIKVKNIIKENNISVIISRTGTATEIEKNVDVPVVKAKITNFELISALWKAKQVDSKVAFFKHMLDDQEYELGLMENMLNINIETFVYSYIHDLEEQIILAKNKGIKVIVGAGIGGNKTLEMLGIDFFVIHASFETVSDSIQQAKTILETRLRDKEHLERIREIIHLSPEGIIIVDQYNKIIAFNSAAERIIEIKSDKVLGQHVYDTYFFQTLIRRFDSAEKIENRVVDYLSKKLVISKTPININNFNYGFYVKFQDVEELHKLEQNIRIENMNHIKRGFAPKYKFDDIIHSSSVMKETINIAKSFATIDSTVLITGESGTGKELFGHSIHSLSDRKNGPFVTVNCAGLSETLLESELFGYVGGAFTGAKREGKSGLFELAHKGTIFLDEIGEISPQLQNKLLRVLQEKEVMRIGDNRIIPVDVRIMAATNVNLFEYVKLGSFRSDLFYRLNVLNLQLVPLRKRREDILVLIEHFLKKYSFQFEIVDVQLTPFLKSWVMEYGWPGNVRELENFIQRFVVLTSITDDSEFLEKYLLENINVFEESDNKTLLTIPFSTLSEMEKEIIKQSYDRLDGQKSRLAEKLQISRSTLWKKLKEIGIS